jgi:Coenzyme PQQ synthesis protein D (PqqD).
MIIIPDSVAASELDDELVLFDDSSGSFAGLNPVAARVFKLLKTTKREEGVVDALCEEYDSPRERIASDVAEFVRMLVERGYARIVAGRD